VRRGADVDTRRAAFSEDADGPDMDASVAALSRAVGRLGEAIADSVVRVTRIRDAAP
jgi:hypothetical protein